MTIDPGHDRFDCFISYASADLQLAEALHGRLAAEGFAVWFDRARLEPGCDWHREIGRAAEASRIALPVLTPRWKESPWTEFETYGAECVIPILCEGNLRDVAPPPLLRFQAHGIDLKQQSGESGQWTRLCAAVRDVLARPAPDKVTRLAQLRYHPNAFFVGRERELLRIHEELHANPTAVLTQGRVRVLAALGGVGKTTLACQYVEKFWRLYPEIFWVDARRGYQSEFAAIFDLVFADHPDRAAMAEAQKAQHALARLNDRTERLLIIDNAEDEQSTQAWIPKTGGCRTLITSRFAGWSAAVKTIHLYVLEKEPACALLRLRAARDADDVPAGETSACASLAEKLGYLPLALEQAAAYIAEQGGGFGFADYLRLYERATADLLAQRALGSTEYPDSVVTTWKATIEKLPAHARAILRVASPMADTPLPLELLTAGWSIVEGCAQEFGAVIDKERDDEAAAIELAARGAAASLKRYSMARFDGVQLSFHNLVQRVEYLRTPADEVVPTLSRAERMLEQDAVIVAENFDHWPKWRVLLPHLCRVREHALAAGLDLNGELVTGMALYHLSQGNYSEALTEAVSAFGAATAKPGFLAGASEANNVAVALSNLGRYDEAQQWIARALEIARRDCRDDHDLVLKFRAQQAITLSHAGQPSEAVALLAELLPVIESRTWFNRKDWIAMRTHLAIATQKSGDVVAGAKLQRESVTYAREHFGNDHPTTIAAAVSLAEMLTRLHEVAEAELLITEAKETADRVLGPDHPQSQSAEYVQAALLHFKGDLAAAQAAYEALVERRVRTMGPDHEQTLAAMESLSTVLRDARKFAEAQPLVQRVADSLARSMGTQHPRTLHARANIASNAALRGDFAEALPLYEAVLTDCERVLGVDHPDTYLAAHSLAVVRFRNGDADGAEMLYRRTIETYERLLGANHPQTIDAMKGLAMIFEATGRKLKS